ncbi:MAG TPA: acyl-CoA dehydrogenase, partial [Actinobacteria bacterium]|nr:acyl-CoA dehydrogenase [Actinomycetota bacterium]
MAFDLTDEQRELRARASSVGIDLASRRSPNEGRVDRELLLELARSGLLGRLFPKGAVSAFDLCLLREGLAQGSTAAETALAMQGLGGYPILQSGRAETVERWVPRIARG